MTLNEYIKENNDKAIEELKEQYSSSKLALLLGSGVSLKYCPLTWQSLVLELFRRKFYFENPGDSIAIDGKRLDSQIPYIDEDTNRIKNVSIIQSSLLDIAEFASTTRMHSNSISDEEELINALVSDRVEKLLLEKYEGLEQGDTALNELASLSFDICSGKTLIDTIVTYNYDDFIESLLLRQMQEYIDVLTNNYSGENLKELLQQSVLNVATIYEENSLHPHYYKDIIHFNRAVSVYHVHGFIPVALSQEYCIENKLYTAKRSGGIVLGDRSYDSLKGNDWLWANSIQTQVFQQKTVLCVGFSCTDPNFRRLAKLVLKKHKRFNDVFAIFTVSDYSGEIPKMLGYDYKFGDSEEEERIICTYLKFITRHYRENYGLKVIWAKNHDSIPNIIREVKSR